MAQWYDFRLSNSKKPGSNQTRIVYISELLLILRIPIFEFFLAKVMRESHKLISGQSYKTFMLVNYDSRVVIWGIFKSGMTLES